MKHKLIETEKARGLIVDLPSDATDVSIKGGNMIHYYGFNRHYDHQSFYVDIPRGTWLPAGNLGEVPEDVAEKIVESFERFFPERHVCYVNYLHPIERGNHLFKKIEQKWTDPFSTATQSLRSLIAANVNLRNKYGYDEGEDTRGKSSPIELYNAQRSWDKEEETVFRNTFLFFELK